MPPGQAGDRDWVDQSLWLTVRREFPHEIIATAEWTAGLTLVAERFRHQRVFLLGDAAHLFTPTGGLGYNTSIDDAANLGWKLAGVCLGWGGPRLLESYETERRPIARRNTRFARAMADSLGSIEVTQAHEDDTPEGAQRRAELGARLYQHATDEFDTQGIQFGVCYGGSPVVVSDGGPPPLDDPHRYTPNATPGARAPHIWLTDGRCLFDAFGPVFTLLQLNPAADASPLLRTATAARVPVAHLALRHDEARDLYGSDLVLIRPDHHVAWRGDRLPDDPADVIRIATGWV